MPTFFGFTHTFGLPASSHLSLSYGFLLEPVFKYVFELESPRPRNPFSPTFLCTLGRLQVYQSKPIYLDPCIP